MSILLSIKSVPSSKLSGLGDRLKIKSNALAFNPVASIVNVSGSSVTLEPDTAYKMYATTRAVTINANPPASGYWGLESHIELFVGSTGYIVTGSNVVLANALEPDAVNNCTVRFHDGLAIIAVEDHVAGYIVVSATGTAAGSLPYGLTSATQEYVAFDATTNGTTLDIGGAVTNGEKHIVGNGYSETVLTGDVSCTSKTTMANLALQNVVVNGGTMTLGDASIPSGSTLTVSSGGLVVEKVTGAGSESVIDLGGAAYIGVLLYKASNVLITSGIAGAMYIPYNATGVKFSSCTITGNTVGGSYNSPAIDVLAPNVEFVDCVISGNPIPNGSLGNKDIRCRNAAATIISGCVINGIEMRDGNVTLAGSNAIGDIHRYNTASGSVTISGGAIINLTSSIAPGGGITVLTGGCTVNGNVIPAGTYTSIDSNGQPT